MKRKSEATKPMMKIEQILKIKEKVEKDFNMGRNEYFGMCPRCFEDGEEYEAVYCNIERNHCYYCDKHKLFWVIGSNLFSSWREETEKDWRLNSEKLNQYTEIEEFHPEDLFNLRMQQFQEIAELIGVSWGNQLK